MSFSVRQKAELLEESKWANDFSWEQIQRLAEHLDAYRYHEGVAIFKEAAPGDSMGIVVKGQVDIVKRDTDGKLKTFATLGPGKLVGEMSLIDGSPRSADAVARTEVTILIMTTAQLSRIGQQMSGLGMRLMWKLAKTLSERMRKLMGQLVDHLGHLD